MSFFYRGITVHYPNLALYKGGKIIKTIPGYKTMDTYMKRIPEILGAGMGSTRVGFKNPAKSTNSPVPVDSAIPGNVQIITEISTPRRVNFYFKPVPYTDLVVYGNRNYVFNLKDKNRDPRTRWQGSGSDT